MILERKVRAPPHILLKFRIRNVYPINSRSLSMASYSLSDFKIRLIFSILTEVFDAGRSLDKAYAIYFRKLKLDNDEQALIVSLVNDVFRRLNYYTYVAGYKKIKDVKKHINKIICVIHLVHKWPVPRGLPDCEDFSIKDAKARMEEADNIPNLKYGCPVWLDEFGKKELGEKWEAEKPCFAKEPRRFIRANTLKTTRKELMEILAAENITTRECPLPDALEVLGTPAIFKTVAFKKGLFEQQDTGSQEIPLFLDPRPGNKVIDACAGAGGKTLYLSALMKGRGSIIAMDDKQWKLDDLKLRARRAGAYNIETRLIDTTKVIKRQYGKADCVLLDVPCSGSGVLKRNPETKWTDGTDTIRELIQIQADILSRYSKMTKVGGTLVYSTCSIFPCEDHNQIAAFLENNPDFELLDEKTVYPSAGGDGFYMAKLKRKENSGNVQSAGTDGEDSVTGTKNLEEIKENTETKTENTEAEVPEIKPEAENSKAETEKTESVKEVLGRPKEKTENDRKKAGSKKTTAPRKEKLNPWTEKTDARKKEETPGKNDTSETRRSRKTGTSGKPGNPEKTGRKRSEGKA